MFNLFIKIISKIKILVQIIFSQDSSWLYKNRIERMDANRLDIFESSRALFHLDRYEFASRYVKAKKVLGAACGTGYGSSLLSIEGSARDVIGLDNDLSAVKYSRAKYSSDYVYFVSGSIIKLPFADSSFDAVVSFETIEHVSEEEALLIEVYRVLRNHAIFILSTPNDWGLNELAPFHVRSYTIQQLKETLSKHFEIREIFNQNSGTSGRKENHNQPRGMIKTNEQNYKLAECYVIIAAKINKSR